MTGTGIYLWINQVNDKVYVGSTARSFAVRYKEWVMALDGGTTDNSHLLAAWRKYGGLTTFVFVPVEECAPDICLEREQYWIDLYESYDRAKGYNLRPKAHNNTGWRWSEDQKERFAHVMTGRKMSEECKAKLSAAHLGKIKPEVTESNKRRKGETREYPKARKGRILGSMATMQIAQLRRRKMGR